jgi:ketosteroid isomerase-like protein
MSDREDIADTLHRGGRAFDEADIDALADCFTEDGELVSHEGVTSGRPAIHRAMAERRGDRSAEGQPRHLITNIEIDVESEGVAACRSYFALLNVDGAGGVAIAAAGVYFDRFAKDDGVWRITRRYVKVDPHAVVE